MSTKLKYIVSRNYDQPQAAFLTLSHATRWATARAAVDLQSAVWNVYEKVAGPDAALFEVETLGMKARGR